MIREVEPPKPSTRLSSSEEPAVPGGRNRELEPGEAERMVRRRPGLIVMKCLERSAAGALRDGRMAWRLDVQRYLADETVLASLAIGVVLAA